VAILDKLILPDLIAVGFRSWRRLHFLLQR
jgi:hypothetical protein